MAIGTRKAAGWRAGLPVLCGDGLRLREPVPSDAGRLAGLVTPQTAWPFSAKAPVSPSGWVRLLERLAADRASGLSSTFAVEHELTADVVGLIGIRRLELNFRIAECRFLFREAAWDSDMPLAGLSYALDFAFRDVGVHRLEARTLTGREGVLLRGLGMVQEGLLRDAYPLWGGLASQTIWAMLRTEWRSGQLPSPVRLPAGSLPPEAAGRPAGTDEDDPLPAWTKAVPPLSGPRVTLREMEPADGDALLRVLDPSDIEACIEPTITTGDMFRDYIGWARTQREMGRAVSLAVLVNGHPEPVGMIQIRSEDASFTVGEWGMILACQHRETGVFDEAMALVAGFAFDTLGIQRLEARMNGNDFPAIGAMTRFGFVKEARLRRSFPTGGDYRDDELWVHTGKASGPSSRARQGQGPSAA